MHITSENSERIHTEFSFHEKRKKKNVFHSNIREGLRKSDCSKSEFVIPTGGI